MPVCRLMCAKMSVRLGGDGRRSLPPGFRFRPTDEELLTHYLAPKVADAGFAVPAAVREVDLYGAEPWDLLPLAAAAGGYFFCRRSVKFPSGLRTNRATRAGYWKSTGKDKVVLRQRQHGGGGEPIGLKKTLVFYRGRAPAGDKTNWVMHEYRLAQGRGYTPPVITTAGTQSEWVICRVFMRRKPQPGDTNNLRPEVETTVLHRHPLNDHLNPSFQACNGGDTPAASDDPGHANCFSGAVAMIEPAADHNETGHQGVLRLDHDETAGQGVPRLNHDDELPLPMNYSAAHYAPAATPAPLEPELLQQAASLLRDDDLSSDSFDLLPQLLDYEGFPFLQDF